uniref:DUF7869 domain-containing protein n=2 Tax=Cacopsylla melanoneura TaxID=428564 RepID=A0A8D8SK62_9HEMI
MSLSPKEIHCLNSVKKRNLNTDNWVDKKLQLARNAGQEYVNRRGKGIRIRAKNPPAYQRGCREENCTRGGCESLTLVTVHNLHEVFYKLNYNEHNLFLLRHVNIRSVKRRRPGKRDDNSTKLAGYDYKISGTPVCRATFLNTFSINVHRLRTLQEKIKARDLVARDKRGSHTNRPRATNHEDIDQVRLHIRSFPLMENHYSRRVSTKKCLNYNLSVKKMHRLFHEKFPNHPVSYSLYRKVFIRDFNLRFGTPRSDTCKKCDKFYAQLILASSDEEKQTIETETTEHHMEADEAYKILAEDGENPNLVTLCVDLQQVIVTPMLTHSDVYYQRQYSNYNLAVHNMTKKQANMFLWHQMVAKRGAKDIGSCMLNYVVTNFKKLGPREERKLVIWSDRCVGQNNNKTILSLCMFFIRCRFFSEVHQKFLVTGHSFLPCDRDFALIEREKKKTKLMVPSQIKYMIGASNEKSPFIITEMQQADFKDLDLMAAALLRDNIRQFQVTKYVWYKMST